MKEILKVTFTYRDLSAPRDRYGFLTSKFKRFTYTFKDVASVDAYVETHRKIKRYGETLTLLWYDIEYFYFGEQKRISLQYEHDKE